jgi:hypothetical protein
MRPSRKPSPCVKFSQALFDGICARLAEGESLRSICEAIDMPDRHTVTNWAKGTPELQAQYDAACTAREETYFEQIIEIADTADDPAKARNQIEARKWTLARMNRKKYGEHVKQEITGADGGPLQHMVSNSSDLLGKIRGGA